MRTMWKTLKRRLIVSTLVLGFAHNAFGEQISGVEIPDTLELESGVLILNGAGVRTKLFIDLYVGALYLAQLSQDADLIVQAKESMAIRLHILSSRITGRKMEKATREGFKKATGGDTKPLDIRIDSFLKVFAEGIKEDDRYEFVYMPETGTTIHKNGKMYSVIEGDDFKQALFGIWLSADPAQEKLKQAMLGR